MRLASVLCALFVTVTAATAQDPVKVASENYSVLTENLRVRVLHVTLPPGSKPVMHEHPAHVAVSLSDGTVRLELPDGKATDIEMKADTARLMPAGKHAISNPGTSPMEVIVIELKARPGTASLPTSRPGMKMTPVLEDARVVAHRVAFEPSFSEPEGTTHEYDQVVIPLGPSDTALKVADKTFSTWKRGDAVMIDRGVPHASKAGTQSAEMIIVSIK